jgi:hypothetical protein
MTRFCCDGTSCYRETAKIGNVFRPNTREIAVIARYVHEQGLTARRLMAEDLFVASMFDLAKV